MRQMIFKTLAIFVCLNKYNGEFVYFESFVFLLKVSPSDTGQEHSVLQILILYAKEYIILSIDCHSNS